MEVCKDLQMSFDSKLASMFDKILVLSDLTFLIFFI